MSGFKRFFAWLRGPKSDFILFLVVLVLANLAGARAFLRLDLTARNSYSLSDASRATLRTVEEPLSVKVFFTKSLPAPYNSVERYIKDLLLEYKGLGNKNFSYELFDMDKAENKDLAESYGIYPIQVQEVKNDEVGVKNAYMGLSVSYRDGEQTLNDLTSSDGLEYRLTTTISKLVATSDTLAGLDGKVKVSLYASSALSNFHIQGFDGLDKAVRGAFEKVNAKNRGRLEYQFVDQVDPSVIDGLCDKYGLQKISWKDQGNTPAGSGVLGLALEYGDKVRSIPISLSKGLFGGYSLSGLSDLENSLGANLQALLSASLSVGYLTGHGERDLYDEQQGAGRFASISSDLYEFVELDLSKDEIPANVTTLVIDGPKEQYSQEDLYKVDQFLMRGGRLMVMLDPFNEVNPQGQYGGSQPVYLPIETGLEGLLKKYGITVGQNYVLDDECYIARQQGAGEVPLYYVPIVRKSGMNQDNPVTRNLANVLFLKAAELKLDLPEKAGDDRVGTPLVTSSDQSWLLSGRISLIPYMLTKPEASKLAKRDLAVLVEGHFPSAFDAAVVEKDKKEGNGADLSANTHLAKGVQSGKILVIGTSEVTAPSLIDASGSQPVAVFVRNSLDYLTGNGDLNDMRTKGLGLDPLNKTTPAARTAAKSLNMYGLPLVAAFAGLIAWRIRVRRKERIKARYAKKSGTGMEG